jgi:hypothetical protein
MQSNDRIDFWFAFCCYRQQIEGKTLATRGCTLEAPLDPLLSPTGVRSRSVPLYQRLLQNPNPAF